MDRIGSTSAARQCPADAAGQSWNRGVPTEEDVLDWLENHAQRKTRRPGRLASPGRRHPRRLARWAFSG